MARAALAKHPVAMTDFVTDPLEGLRVQAPRTGLAQLGRDALYLTLGLLTSIVAFAVWVAGLTLSLSLAVFIVGLPVILASAIAFRWTAELDRLNAVLVRGRRIRGTYRDHRGERFFVRLRTTLGDPQTWRDLLWLVLHSVIGFTFGVVAVSLIASVLGILILPAWYWAIPDGVQFGLRTVDSLWEAFATAALAIPLGLATAGLVRAMALGEAGLASAFLG